MCFSISFTQLVLVLIWWSSCVASSDAYLSFSTLSFLFISLLSSRSAFTSHSTTVEPTPLLNTLPNCDTLESLDRTFSSISTSDACIEPTLLDEISASRSTGADVYSSALLARWISTSADDSFGAIATLGGASNVSLP